MYFHKCLLVRQRDKSQGQIFKYKTWYTESITTGVDQILKGYDYDYWVSAFAAGWQAYVTTVWKRYQCCTDCPLFVRIQQGMNSTHRLQIHFTFSDHIFFR